MEGIITSMSKNTGGIKIGQEWYDVPSDYAYVVDGKYYQAKVRYEAIDQVGKKNKLIADLEVLEIEEKHEYKPSEEKPTQDYWKAREKGQIAGWSIDMAQKHIFKMLELREKTIPSNEDIFKECKEIAKEYSRISRELIEEM